MATIPSILPTGNPTVSYARLYGTLEGYAVQTPAGLVFVDHDQHLYALGAEHAAALTLLAPVGGVERANVLAVLACVEEACG